MAEPTQGLGHGVSVVNLIIDDKNLGVDDIVQISLGHDVQGYRARRSNSD